MGGGGMGVPPGSDAVVKMRGLPYKVNLVFNPSPDPDPNP